MSYQPESKFDKEYPRIFAQRDRLLAFASNRPVAFSLRIWFAILLCCTLIFSLSGLEGFSTTGRILALSYALLGWLLPFVLWIRERKSHQK